MNAEALACAVRACTLCAPFLPLGPRPIVQFSATSRIVVIGQAPGTKAHASGIPFADASGARLSAWMGVTSDELHDPARIALVSMGLCYPGKASGGDLPPRPECAPTWHDRIWATLPGDRLVLLVGVYAQAAYLPDARRLGLAARVRRFAEWAPFFPLPHPSWRAALFERDNPWFAAEVLPALRTAVAQRMR